MISEQVIIFLIAPNVSEQMGGEAMKALQIYQQLKQIHQNTIQITHGRNEIEIRRHLKLQDVLFVKDDWITIFLWKSLIFQWLVDAWFSHKAIAIAEDYVMKNKLDPSKVIIHQTEPNSPVIPRTISKNFYNVFGPINGNIYYPEIFRAKETFKTKVRRVFHIPFQKVNSLFFRGVAKADLLFIAGGSRTKNSMLAAGARPKKMIDSLDCGIKDEILNRPRVKHKGENFKFIHFGRLVFHKCTFLIIESLVKTKNKILLDIVGKGPELERCQALAKELGVEDRVNFLGWYTNHDELLDSLENYRGFILPSIEDSNGIVVQEAMTLGLPAICLDWGGPQLLVENGVTGYLIEPKNQEFITNHIAKYLDELAVNGDLAEKMSIASREKAQNWRWSTVINQWTGYYLKLLT
ncbi:MAG: glycosyltransferase [Rhizonema sp. PD37]|nr:glycosyltransferase [Rhizonema sp. PD37]